MRNVSFHSGKFAGTMICPFSRHGFVQEAARLELQQQKVPFSTPPASAALLCLTEKNKQTKKHLNLFVTPKLINGCV